MSLQEAKQFVALFVSGDYTPEEYATFLLWLRGANINDLNAIADEHEALQGSWSLPETAPSPEWVTMLEGKLDELTDRKDETPVVPIETGSVIKRRFWIAAASVAVAVSAGMIFYTERLQVKDAVVAKDQGTVTPALSRVEMNPAGGGQKEVTLADGSKVWLNVASTLKYPEAFTGSERVVELSGEAFFEVAKSAGKPFRVLIKDAEVEVLGTHFNIMAYNNEPISKTTLIDGGIRLKSGAGGVDLKPGDQASMRYPAQGSGEPKIELSQGNAGAVLNWRKGDINLTDADLPTVMRVLERYYNVDIQYAQGLPATSAITAGLIRQDGLQHNLKVLEGFFGVHFKTDGKIVTVTR